MTAGIKTRVDKMRAAGFRASDTIVTKQNSIEAFEVGTYLYCSKHSDENTETWTKPKLVNCQL